MMKNYLVCLFFIIFTHSAVAQDILLQTRDVQNSIIELYTSQGCNSCPPAEHLLNSYKQETRVWRNIVPLAFHVDYWDYLGWKDRFAQPVFAARQRKYARQQHRSTVFTPAFFVNGKSWRPGLFSNTPPLIMKNKTGKLKLHLDNQNIQASFHPVQVVDQPYHLNIVLLGMGLTTQIKAGENAGRLSHHEFVVLKHKTFTSQNRRWHIAWPFKNYPEAPQYAIAAWVNIGDNLAPVQATGSYLPGSFLNEKN